MQDNLTGVSYMTSAIEALNSYIKRDYCLVVLDIQLSNIDNMELLRAMQQSKYTPILALTQSSNIADKVALLHAGADACIDKPVDLEYCVAQANALIRLRANLNINCSQHSPIVRGELIISPHYRQVMIAGRPLPLTRKEFDLFLCLASSPGQVFSREQLYDCIWGDGPAIAVDEAVKTQIKRLRGKLALAGKNYIQTEWGIGYKFVLYD